MSHFTCLVVGEDPDKQLEPYQENSHGDCPEEFLEFYDAEKLYKADFDSGKESVPAWYHNGVIYFQEIDFEQLKRVGSLLRKKFKRQNYHYRHDFQIGQRIKVQKYDLARETADSENVLYVQVNKFELVKAKSEEYFSFYFKVIDPPEEIPLNTRYKSFEEYLVDWHGSEIDPKTGKYGYWENPNKKWDWYVLGGRWKNYFKIKEEYRSKYGREWVDQALKKEIDFEGMREANIEKAKKWWSDALSEDPVIRSFSYGVRKDDTEETYVKRCSELNFHSFLVDGKWYEKGKMGWFGVSIDNKETSDWLRTITEVLDYVGDDELLSLIDCHI